MSFSDHWVLGVQINILIKKIALHLSNILIFNLVPSFIFVSIFDKTVINDYIGKAISKEYFFNYIGV